MEPSPPGGLVVRHKKNAKLPEGAVLMSEADALQQQWENVGSWKSKTELWPIKYGFVVCGAVGALSGVFLTNFYRRKLKLVDEGFMASYFPSVALPGILNAAFHYKYVTSDILLSKTVCPLCIEVRATAIQVVFGLAYPMVLAPIVSFSFAELYQKYPLPPMRTHYKEMFSIFQKITRPAMPVLKAFFCMHVLVAVGLTYLQGNTYHRVCAEMLDAAAMEEYQP